MTAEGVYQVFEIVSDFGNIEAEGRTVLRTRVREVDALARLSEVSKGEIFAKAAGGAVLAVGKGVVSVVKDPEGTAKGIGGGIKRFGVNLGRKAKRAADSATKDDKKADDDGESTSDKALDAAGGAANSVLGVNSAARKWARKLGVDPYTTNPVLHKALVDVGKIDTAGSIATKVVLPMPALVSGAATVGDLVWSQGPGRAAQDQRGAAGRDRSLEAGRFPLPRQRQLHAHHADEAYRRPPRGEGPRGAPATSIPPRTRRTSAKRCSSSRAPRWLARMHKTEPVSALLRDSRGVVAKRGSRAVALLPVDWVRWTEEIQRVTTESAARASGSWAPPRSKCGSRARPPRPQRRVYVQRAGR